MSRMTTEPERVVYSQWSEADLDAEVRRLCLAYGWRYYHSYTSLRSAAGYPDVTLVRPPRVLFAELKKQGGRLTTARLVTTRRGYPRWVAGQVQWLGDLSACPGVETYLWMPEDVADIIRILDAGPEEGMACLRRLKEVVDAG